MNVDESNPRTKPCDEVTSHLGDFILKISAVFFLSNFVPERLNVYLSVPEKTVTRMGDDSNATGLVQLTCKTEFFI